MARPRERPIVGHGRRVSTALRRPPGRPPAAAGAAFPGPVPGDNLGRLCGRCRLHYGRSLPSPRGNPLGPRGSFLRGRLGPVLHPSRIPRRRGGSRGFRGAGPAASAAASGGIGAVRQNLVCDHIVVRRGSGSSRVGERSSYLSPRGAHLRPPLRTKRVKTRRRSAVLPAGGRIRRKIFLIFPQSRASVGAHPCARPEGPSTAPKSPAAGPVRLRRRARPRSGRRASSPASPPAPARPATSRPPRRRSKGRTTGPPGRSTPAAASR